MLKESKDKDLCQQISSTVFEVYSPALNMHCTLYFYRNKC